MSDASEIVEKPGPEVLPAKQGVGSMGSWKTVVWATGILVATGIGAEIAPPAEGQTKIARQVKPAIVQVLAGTGSWIGVSVRDVVADDVSKMKLQGPAGVVV